MHHVAKRLSLTRCPPEIWHPVLCEGHMAEPYSYARTTTPPFGVAPLDSRWWLYGGAKIQGLVPFQICAHSSYALTLVPLATVVTCK